MSLDTVSKAEIVSKHQRFQGDTGSSEVQVALLSASITQLTEHLKGNPKDHHSRRGLLKMVSKRRRLLNYLRNTNLKLYQALITTLGLRR